MPTGVLLAPIGNPEPKGLRPSGHLACPCSGYPSCSCTLDMLLPEQVKQALEICPGDGQISVPVFVQRRLGKAYAEDLQNHQSWLMIFVMYPIICCFLFWEAMALLHLPF